MKISIKIKKEKKENKYNYYSKMYTITQLLCSEPFKQFVGLNFNLAAHSLPYLIGSEISVICSAL